MRIRHYGFLSSSYKKDILPMLQKQLYDLQGIKAPKVKAPITQHRSCPRCKQGRLVTILDFDNRGPPTVWQIIFDRQPQEAQV